MVLELVVLVFGGAGAGAGAGADAAVPGTLGLPVLSERMLPQWVPMGGWYLTGGRKGDGEGLSRGMVGRRRTVLRQGFGSGGLLRIDAEMEHSWPSDCVWHLAYSKGMSMSMCHVDVDVDVRCRHVVYYTAVSCARVCVLRRADPTPRAATHFLTSQ